MIRHVVAWLCALQAALGIGPPAHALAGDKDLEAVDRYVIDRMRTARIPGLTLAIVRGEDVVYLKGYGRADPSGRPVTPRTPFMIGSVTKPFTALAVMQLVEEGKVELDAPVQRYLPWFRVADPQASARITVRELLNQTSGIPQGPTLETWAWPNTADAIERHVRLLAPVKLAAPPGSKFIYANANFATQGMILQTVSGMPYESYVRRRIFEPLDMRHSYASQDEAIRDGMATGYRWWFGAPIPARVPFNRSNLPAGFIASTAEDMAHFLVAQMNGGRYKDRSVLSPEGIASMWVEPRPQTYALGWETTVVDGRKLVYHDGGTANFQSSMFFDPEERVGVFLAANVVNALDVFSSPHGSSPLEGITLRPMALTVWSITTHRPPPDQGIGIARLSLIFDLVIASLTLLLAWSVARMPRRYRRLTERGLAGASDAARRSVHVAALHFAWPLALWYGARTAPYWILLTYYQPDLVLWLVVMACVVVLKGVLEILLIWRALRTRGAATAPIRALSR